MACALVASGCAVELPTAPSVPTVPVTVKAYVRGSEAPLAGARVLVNGHPAGQTDAGGVCVVDVPVVAVSIRVEATGYVGFSAEADRVRAGETWGFFLEQVT